MEQTIWLNSGHHLLDVGARHHGLMENIMTIALRNKIVPLVKSFAKIEFVPDHLTLRESIDWINSRADKNDLAFSIHLNSHSNKYVRGTEAYYSNEREQELAITFSEEVSKASGFKNRGAKHDSQTWVGSLGWLRKLNCDSVLVEVCYLTSDMDMQIYDEDKIVQGFVNAIHKALPQQKELPKVIRQKLTLIALLKKLVELLRQQIDLIIKNK